MQMDTLDIFPRGLYLDEIISVARTELAEECNYELEAVNQVSPAEHTSMHGTPLTTAGSSLCCVNAAVCQKKFRANVLSKDELSDFFVVPEVA